MRMNAFSHSKTAPEHPKRAQDTFKAPQNRPKSDSRRSKTRPRSPQDAPRRTPKSPRAAQDAPRRPQNDQSCPKSGPRTAPERPKSGQEPQECPKSTDFDEFWWNFQAREAQHYGKIMFFHGSKKTRFPIIQTRFFRAFRFTACRSRFVRQVIGETSD